MIIFESVWKQYAKELFRTSAPPALQNLSFDLQKGKTLGLIGVNGAGKSTSIRIIMDFIRQDKGLIKINGCNPHDVSLRYQIGYLPETASFPVNLTLYDLTRFTADTCGISKKIRNERRDYLLSELGLWGSRDKKLRSYSKGMQQRANFVLALLNDPHLLILDEPMSGLDPLGRKLILNLIKRLKEEGKTILFCSHILSDVDQLADQLLVLHKGQSLFNGSPTAFVAQQGGTTIEDAFLSLIRAYEREHHAA